MSNFRAMDFQPIGRGALLAKVRILMPSGLIVNSLIFQDQTDPKKISVAPAAPKTVGGRYEHVVEFANSELKRSWTEQALAVVRPHLAAMSQEQEVGYDVDGNF